MPLILSIPETLIKNNSLITNSPNHNSTIYQFSFWKFELQISKFKIQNSKFKLYFCIIPMKVRLKCWGGMDATQVLSLPYSVFGLLSLLYKNSHYFISVHRNACLHWWWYFWQFLLVGNTFPGFPSLGEQNCLLWIKDFT